jgi:MYXO-CTERM domain-containing protein
VAAPPYADVGVSGNTTYYYIVRGVECAESPDSNEASVTATGVCTLPPTFAGVTSVSNAAASTCSTAVSWDPATPICGGTLTYSVYRSTTPGFTPSVGNRIATGIAGTSFADDLNLMDRTKYYYVVRAVETSNATNEDTNTVEKSGAPTGTATTGFSYFDDLDGNRPPNASAYWIASANTINLTTGCHYQSATSAYRFGQASAACAGSYPVNAQATLSLGGDGSTAGINGFAIPATTLNAQMTFNIWYKTESLYDGAWLVYSTTSATGPWINVSDTASPTAPYISAGGYDGALKSSSTTRIWTGTNAGANGSLKAVTVNVAALAGQTVWFGYKFYSDVSFTDEGVYIDDVRITADAYGSCTTNVPPPGPAVSYVISGLPATTGAGDSVTFDVTALDAVGQTATSYAGSASFTSSDPQAVLPPVTSFTAGVATGVPLSLRTLGTQTITAMDTTNPAVMGSASTSVTPGAPVALNFLTQPSDTKAGYSISPSVQVGMLDQFGNQVDMGSNDISIDLGTNAGGGTLSGTLTVTASNGVATFSDLSLDKIGDGYTLTASSAGLTGTTSGAFTVLPGDPAKLAFLTQPSDTVAGAAIAPPVQLMILDQFDNPTTASLDVSIDLGNNPSGTYLAGRTDTAAEDGIATFSDLSLYKTGEGYTLYASSSGLDSAESGGFNITPAAPYRVVITQQPSNTVAGASMSPPVAVTILDEYDNTATQATAPVSVSLVSNPSGAMLRGATSVTPVDGVATFDNLAVSKPGLNYVLLAGAGGLRADTSLGFDVTARAQGDNADKLVFRAAPETFEAGAELTSIEVELQDADGNVLTGSSATVTLSLEENPAGGQLLGNTTVAAVNGVATFTGLSVRKAGNGYVLAANANGFDTGASSAFAVTPGPAASFELSLPASVTAGEETTFSATAHDAYGNVAASYGGTVNVASSDNAATFDSTATFVEGVLSNFKVTFKTTGLRTLTLTDASAASLTSASQTNVTAFAQPTVSVTSPAGGTVVSGSVSISAEGAVAAGTTLAKLSILVDGAEIASGTDTTVTGNWDSSKAQAGSHIITAVITDGAGSSVSSAPVVVSTEEGGCGCGATSGADASIYMGLLLLARYALGRRRAKAA